MEGLLQVSRNPTEASAARPGGGETPERLTNYMDVRYAVPMQTSPFLYPLLVCLYRAGVSELETAFLHLPDDCVREEYAWNKAAILIIINFFQKYHHNPLQKMGCPPGVGESPRKQ